MPYLHHVAIHFPIALGMLAALACVLGWIRGGWFRDGRRLLSYLVAFAAVVAVTSGLLSASHVVGEIDVASVARHRNVALIAASIASLTALIGFVGARRARGPLVKTSEIGSLLTATALGLAGHFGGDMLHPGLTPWSTEPHSHGMKHEHAAAHGDDRTPMPMPTVEDAAAASDVSPAALDSGATDAMHVHSHGPHLAPHRH